MYMYSGTRSGHERLELVTTMEDFFSLRCVTADASAVDDAGLSAPQWASASRCELVLVQEQRGAFGASRQVLASVVSMVAECKKTTKVMLLAMDSPKIFQAANNEKLVMHDYAGDKTLLRALLDEDSKESLLRRLEADVDEFTSGYKATSGLQAPSASSRPIVVVIDSINTLLTYHSQLEVQVFIKKLRANPLIGCVIGRLDASAAAIASVQALSSTATALVLVETPRSLSAYSILSKERQREIPKSMDGLVQLIRLKKNARASESVEFFRVENGTMQYFDAKDDAEDVAAAKPASLAASKLETSKFASKTNESKPSLSAISLPVAQDEVSFSLTMTQEEQAAKMKVELPYIHQGIVQSEHDSSGMPLASSASPFFIDEDDPDWDDDDLDDDLDI